jgi:hypothetical protein
MHQCIPAVLVPTLECYVSAVAQRLPDFLGSFYVVGSIALDEFNPYFSDVDFVAGIRRTARESEVQALKEIHSEIDRDRPRWKLEGMYQLESQWSEAGDFLNYHDGHLNLHPAEPDPVTWWILKHHGIPLLGPDPRFLPITADADLLVSWTRQNMNTYWRSWTRRPGRLVQLLSDWGIQWAVLGVSRQFYTLREHGILSKRRAGEYALSTVPARWYRILREAIRIRTRSGAPLYRARLRRMIDAVNFMKYIMQVSNPLQNG